jgi:hypothetical protein
MSETKTPLLSLSNLTIGCPKSKTPRPLTQARREEQEHQKNQEARKAEAQQERAELRRKKKILSENEPSIKSAALKLTRKGVRNVSQSKFTSKINDPPIVKSYTPNRRSSIGLVYYNSLMSNSILDYLVDQLNSTLSNHRFLFFLFLFFYFFILF